jgi:predicted nucleotidyltransferase
MSKLIPEVAQRMPEVAALCQSLGVRRLEIFGSATTGAFRQETSDLDFLVEFENPDLLGYAERYFDLLEALERLFQRPVDLVVASAIRNPYFRDSVQRTVELLYAA